LHSGSVSGCSSTKELVGKLIELDGICEADDVTGVDALDVFSTWVVSLESLLLEEWRCHQCAELLETFEDFSDEELDLFLTFEELLPELSGESSSIDDELISESTPSLKTAMQSSPSHGKVP
jgi:hypothetical protein